MIYLTGDTHGRFTRLNDFKAEESLTKDDYLIICGDFGAIWDQKEESNIEKYTLDKLNDKNYTVLFIDGNHENFDRLYKYPVEEWNGGKVHKIRENVFHLMRGQVFNIDGKKIFTFGGAESHDISGGILNAGDPYFEETRKELEANHIPYRINHIEWWKEELPTKEEMDEGMENLKKNDFSVDYILTHCAPTYIQEDAEFIKKHKLQPNNILTDYLESIDALTNYRRWFFGHYHKNERINNKMTMIHDQIIKLV